MPCHACPSIMFPPVSPLGFCYLRETSLSLQAMVIIDSGNFFYVLSDTVALILAGPQLPPFAQSHSAGFWMKPCVNWEVLPCLDMASISFHGQATVHMPCHC
ncbi:hypothetical protein AMECASPLE_013476 [Ameca splendens]|uniref:Uncharacterized protein n=1 Tax=Ameca splendens TaxID=208324 RepID=A0ABV0ZMD4_9TELE